MGESQSATRTKDRNSALVWAREAGHRPLAKSARRVDALLRLSSKAIERRHVNRSKAVQDLANLPLRSAIDDKTVDGSKSSKPVGKLREERDTTALETR